MLRSMPHNRLTTAYLK